MFKETEILTDTKIRTNTSLNPELAIIEIIEFVKDYDEELYKKLKETTRKYYEKGE